MMNKKNADFDYLSIQHKLALKLAGSLDLNSILTSCLDVLFRVSDMDCGGVYLFNKTTSDLELVIDQGLSQQFVEDVKHVKKGSDRWDLVKKGLPVYIEYEQLPFYFSEAQINEGLKSFVLLPLQYLGNAIGCINLASHAMARIVDEQRKFFETIAMQIAPIIDRAVEQQSFILKSQKYEHLFNDFQGYIIICDLNQHILEVNLQLLTSLDYALEDIIGEPATKILEPNFITQYQGTFFQNQGGKKWKKLSIRTRAGEIIEGIASITLSVWGSEPAYLIQCLDIEPQDNLINSNYLNNVFDSYDKLPIPVFLVDQNTLSVIYATQIAAEQYKLKKDDVSQYNFLQFFETESSLKFTKLIQENRFAEISGIIWKQINSSGETFDVRIFLRPFYEAGKRWFIIVANPYYPFEDEKFLTFHDRYRSVLDQQTDLILRFSPEGIITYANQAYCEFFETTLDHLIGTPFITNVYPSDLEIVTNHLSLLTPQTPIHQSKNRMLDKHKKIHWFTWIDKAIYQGEKLIEIQSVGRNITHETHPINSEVHIWELLENIPVIFYLLEATTLFPVFINLKLEKMVGFTKEEIFRNPQFWKNQIHVDDYELWLTVMRERRFEGKTRTIEFRLITKSGEVIWLLDQGVLIDIPGQGKFLIGIIADITKR